MPHPCQASIYGNVFPTLLVSKLEKCSFSHGWVSHKKSIDTILKGLVSNPGTESNIGKRLSYNNCEQCIQMPVLTVWIFSLPTEGIVDLIWTVGGLDLLLGGKKVDLIFSQREHHTWKNKNYETYNRSARVLYSNKCFAQVRECSSITSAGFPKSWRPPPCFSKISTSPPSLLM